MNAEEAKYHQWLTIWSFYLSFKDVLEKAGIPRDRLPVREKIEKKLFEFHHDKLQASLAFLNEFYATYIKPWKKIRDENPEDYWSRAKLFKWGDEYVEIRELNRASKLIRENWFNRKNILVKQKREKTNAK